jgi:hypothetical protein
VNALTATSSATSLVAGLEVDVLPNQSNTTTTPTLNLAALGAKTITKLGTAALVAGDYTNTAIAKFIYDGTGWELQNPQSAATGCGTGNIPCTNTANSFTAGTQAISTGSPSTVGLTVSGTTGSLTPTFVQSTGTTAFVGNTATLTFSSAITVGNTIVITIQQDGTSPTNPTVSDSLSNTCTQQATQTSGFPLFLYTCPITTAGSDTVTVVSNAPDVHVMEYSGIALASPLDVKTSSTGTAANPQTVGPITTTQQDLMLTLFSTASPSSPTASASGYTTRQTTVDTLVSNMFLVTADQTAAAGTYTASWANNVSGSTYTGLIIALKGATSVSQTADLLQFKSSSGTLLGKVGPAGDAKYPSLHAAVYTVSTLPSASSLTAGTQVTVSDASSFTPGTCTGGGSDYMIAITNGSTWSCH